MNDTSVNVVRPSTMRNVVRIETTATSKRDEGEQRGEDEGEDDQGATAAEQRLGEHPGSASCHRRRTS